MRVAKLAEKWLEHKRTQYEQGKLKAATLRSYEDTMRYVVEHFGDLRVGKSLSNADIHKRMGAVPGSYPPRVKSVLAQMYGFHGVNENVFRRVSAGVKVNRVTAVPSLETVFQLANACGEYWPLVVGLAASGLRFGEAAALTEDVVNIERRQVRVASAYCQVERQIQATKTENVRTAMIASFGVFAFEAPIHESAYLFSGRRGKPLDSSTFHRDFWQRAKRELSLTWRIHDLRHFYATYMLGKGVPVATVAAWLGHSSAQTTMRVYAGFIEEDYSVWAQRV